ncbi:hypothetical protein [Desulfosporosinus sp. BG]|uniref:hypothetical protein n=1 Tax=Desulfosporosinus sp. BG TaxID=1633135 RepID=UPI00083A66AB|nr:hypothetical protein [Desulfosporosinus sp. BG]ODA40638.1 Mobile element protein [Desulfosporosinus sp. BG]
MSQQLACEETSISLQTYQRCCKIGTLGADLPLLMKDMGKRIVEKRHELYEAAKARHPERWTVKQEN